MTTPAQPEPAALDLSGYDVRCPTCRRLLGQFIKTETHARTLIAAHQCPEGDRPNPAAELRAAAQLLRERATAATPGPWQARGDYSDAIYSDTSEGIVDVIAGGKWGGEASVFDNEHDATYIALMHPGVGAALADWLESAARRQEATEQAAQVNWRGSSDATAHDRWIAKMTEHEALAVARALLGGQP